MYFTNIELRKVFVEYDDDRTSNKNNDVANGIEQFDVTEIASNVLCSTGHIHVSHDLSPLLNHELAKLYLVKTPFNGEWS